MLQVMADIKPYIINMIAMMTKRFVENVLKKGQKTLPKKQTIQSFLRMI